MKKGKILLIIAILMSFALLTEAAPNYSDPVTVTGRLKKDRSTYYISGVKLEFGDKYTVGSDYNKDGQLTVIDRELPMMANQQVTIRGYRDGKFSKNIIYVTEINGMAYPNTKIDQAQVRPFPEIGGEGVPKKKKDDEQRSIESDIRFQFKK